MEPRFWIVTISEDNLELTIRHEMIGLPSKRKQFILDMAEGDDIVFYVGKKRAGYGGYKASVCDFGPSARITSPAFCDESSVWYSRSSEKYPWRRKISVTLNNRVKAHDIVGNLSFARNKEKWGLYFVAGVRGISADDYEVLKKALET